MADFHDWMHRLPASHIQALRDFRRCARAAYPADPVYLSTALDAGNLTELLRLTADPRKALTPVEAALAIAEMPRDFVLQIDI